MRRFFTIRNGLIVGISLLALSTLVLAVLYVNTILSIAKAPSPQSSIEVNRDVHLAVPTAITAGESFDYRTYGDKLVDAGADVRMQLNCTTNGTESLNTLSTYYSHVAAGHFDVTRSTVIPTTNERIRSSDKCHLELIATYVFYQTDNQGVLRPIQIDYPVRSNDFVLTVPSSDQASAGSTSSSVAVLPDGITDDDRSESMAQPAQASAGASIGASNAQPSVGLLDGLLDLIGLGGSR